LRPRLIPAVAILSAGVLAGCQRPLPPTRVVVAYPVGPASLDPDAAGEEYSISILSNLYETLVDLDHALAVKPGLADSWYTRDDLTWAFVLRPGIRLHDGRPLTAQDVARSLERSRTDSSSRRQGELTSVASVEAEDERTILVRTKFAFAAMPNRLATVPISVPPAREGDHLLGTGPYRVASWTPKGDTTLEAWSGHRDGAPPVRELVFRAVTSASDRVALLRRGDAHLMVDVPVDSLSELRAAGRRMLGQKGLRVISLVMDSHRERNPEISTRRNPFRDLRVRQAMALALDRSALVVGPLGGDADVVDQIVPPSIFGFHQDLPPLAFDRAEARRLLAAAGYADGFTVSLDFMPARYRAIEAVAEALSQQLEQVGIRVTRRPLEAQDFFARTARRESALYLLGWMSTSGDAGATYDFLVHSRGGGYGTQNAGGYTSPETDRQIEAASRCLDPHERLKILRGVAEKIRADMPFIPLYRQTDLYAVFADLEFEPRVDRRILGAQLRWKPQG
jgi:peptide/nickel transport system substrate-binding protein